MSRLNYNFKMLRIYKYRACLIILIAFCLISSLFNLFLANTKYEVVKQCFNDSSTWIVDETQKSETPIRAIRLPDVLSAEPKPSPGLSIFFHETTCDLPTGSFTLKSMVPFNVQKPKTKLRLVQLTARQACAVESAAVHNPNFNVFVLFASPAFKSNSTTQPILNALAKYSNIHFRNLNLWNYAEYTPISKWLKNGDLFRSSYVLSHISDFLRYLTLWRYGGTYLDMDIIMLRSIEDLAPNYTGAESNTHLAAGVMNFSPGGFGHEVAEQCLQDLQHNFDGNDWGNNGPGVITRVMQSICDTKNIEMMLESKHCRGFKVYGRDAFYAIPWPEWNRFFETEYLNQTMERTRESYVAHVWNKHSKQRIVKVGSHVAYGIMAEKNCPKVYAAAGEYF